MDYAIDKIKKQILDLVADAADFAVDQKQLEITVPPKSDMGDLAVPCFYLSKVCRRAPNLVAADLAEKIRPGGSIKAIKADGPYLNFFIKSEVFGRQLLQEIKKMKSRYGRLPLSREKLMIEFSQPNTHKEFHIGHLRNALTGNSLVNVYRFGGYKVLAVNYLGDIGAHVAKCLWALNKFHQGEEPPQNKGKFLGQIYTEAVKKIEANPEYKKEAEAVQQKLESGDKTWLALWKKTRAWSLAEFKEIYQELGIKFDHFFYESEVEKPGKAIVDELLKQGLAEKSQGAVIINLEKYGLKNFLLLKSDGSSLYSTKELALAKLKFEKYQIDRSLVMTDSRQSFYFDQVFKTLEIMGFDQPMTHLPYEFVTLKNGAMSSRSGNVVLFEDFYQQMTARAVAETRKRHADWSEKKLAATAKAIALSAIKFSFLKVARNSVIVFDPDEALSFEGFSGPYIQYTLSRIASVLKKAGRQAASAADYAKLSSAWEKELLLKMAEFPEAVRAAAELGEPSQIAKYLFELSRLFANFYQKESILNSEPAVRQARLALIAAVKQVLANGLSLLGLEAMEQM